MNIWEKATAEAVKIVSTFSPQLYSLLEHLGIDIIEEEDKPPAFLNENIFLNLSKMWKYTPLHLELKLGRKEIEKLVEKSLKDRETRIEIYSRLVNAVPQLGRVEYRWLVEKNDRSILHFEATFPILFMLLHELWHAALNHVERSRRFRNDKLFNIVCDCLVNDLALLLSLSLLPMDDGAARFYAHSIKIVRDHVYNLDLLYNIEYRVRKAATCSEACSLLQPTDELVRKLKKEKIDDSVKHVRSLVREFTCEEEHYMKLRLALSEKCGSNVQLPSLDMLELYCSYTSRKVPLNLLIDMLGSEERGRGESGIHESMWVKYCEKLLLDWQLELARTFETCISLPYDSSYCTRGLVRGMPGDVRRSLKLIVLLDVSDSMSDSEIMRMLYYLHELSRKHPYNLDVKIVAWSDKIMGIYEPSPELVINRGGGTLLRPVLEGVIDMLDPYTILIIYTDSEIMDLDGCWHLLEEAARRAGRSVWISTFKTPPRRLLDLGWEWIVVK